MSQIKYFEPSCSLHIDNLHHNFVNADDYCKKTSSSLSDVFKYASDSDFTLFALSTTLHHLLPVHPACSAKSYSKNKKTITAHLAKDWGKSDIYLTKNKPLTSRELYLCLDEIKSKTPTIIEVLKSSILLHFWEFAMEVEDPTTVSILLVLKNEFENSSDFVTAGTITSRINKAKREDSIKKMIPTKFHFLFDHLIQSKGKGKYRLNPSTLFR